MPMTYGDIANMPVSLGRDEVKEGLEDGCKGFHESLLRSYHILAKVKWLLERDTDGVVILELLAMMESDAFQPYAYFEKKYKEQSEPGTTMTRATDGEGQ